MLVRMLLGGWLAWCVSIGVAAPELRLAAAPAAAILATSLWRPGAGLVLVAGMVPAGALLATAPVRAAELLAWAFLAGWLLRVWRPLSVSGWPRAVMIPTVVYAVAMAASWVGLMVSNARGVPPGALPIFLFQSIPVDYLLFSTNELETITLLQACTGLGLFAAATAITRTGRHWASAIVWAIAVSTAILAIGTVAEVGRQWSEAGFGAWFLARYAQGERFSLHLRDLNAAGSFYVLAGLIAAALALLDRPRRFGWLLLLGVMMPALWLAGSRSSFVAMIAGVLVLMGARSRWRPARTQAVAAAAVVAVTVVSAVLVADWRTDVRGSAGRAVSLRSQFSETTGRMFASAPVLGVGVGRYFSRSAEFMSEELREIYGNENAHNYFAQQFAELGVVGGLSFAWLVIAVVSGGWRQVRGEGASDGVTLGLFAGAAGYLLTCFTGHPLLVSEAAFPFWIAFGAVAGAGSLETHASTWHRAAAAAGLAAAMVSVGIAWRSYTTVSTQPADQGFHGMETDPDGRPFRWMTRHGVTYVPDDPGFIRMSVRAPDRRLDRPLWLETALAGRVVDRRMIPQGDWVTYDVPARASVAAGFRRVDLRVNGVWLEDVRLGRRAAQRPIAVMLRGPEWIPIR